MLPRKFLLVVFMYVATFHYGRPLVEAATCILRQVQAATGTGARERPGAWRGFTAFTFASLLLAVALGESAGWGANEDWWVQEQGTLAVAREGHLTRLGLVVISSMAQIASLAGFAAAVPFSLHLVGASTLGSYVCHSYVNVLFASVVLPHLSGANPYGVMSMLLFLPLVVVTILGPITQQLLMWEFRFLGSLCVAVVKWGAGDCKTNFKSRRDEESQQDID